MTVGLGLTLVRLLHLFVNIAQLVCIRVSIFVLCTVFCDFSSSKRPTSRPLLGSMCRPERLSLLTHSFIQWVSECMFFFIKLAHFSRFSPKTSVSLLSSSSSSSPSVLCPLTKTRRWHVTISCQPDGRRRSQFDVGRVVAYI